MDSSSHLVPDYESFPSESERLSCNRGEEQQGEMGESKVVAEV